MSVILKKRWSDNNLCLHCFQLLPGDQKFIHFPILPLTLGSIKVTVEGHSPVARSIKSKTITVEVGGKKYIDVSFWKSCIINDVWFMQLFH